MDNTKLQATSSWRVGFLRPYESLGSVGAKYCYLNKISYRVFGNLLRELLPPDAYVPYMTCTLDVDGFNLDKFAKLLGEPLRLVKTLSFRQLNLGKVFSGISKAHNFSFDNLKFCPQCMSEGYHSNLHQLMWIDACFLHDCPLEKQHTREAHLPKLGRETRLIESLYKEWFKSENVWRASKDHAWMMIDQSRIDQASKKILFSFRRAETSLAQLVRKGGRPPMVVGKSQKGRIIMTLAVASANNGTITKLIRSDGLPTIRSKDIKCTSAEAEAILHFNEGFFEDLFYGRHVMCASHGITPPWMTVIEELKNSLVKGHTVCLRKFQQSWKGADRVRIGNLNHYINAPYNLQFYYASPCERLVAIHFMEGLLNLENRERTVYLRYNLPEMQNTLASEAINQLITTYSGPMPINAHRIIDDQYEPEIDPENPVKVIVPTGPLVEIIDELFLAYVWSWVWSLFFMEQQIDRTFNGRLDPVNILDKEIVRLSPTYSIQRSLYGLKINIGANAPYKQPPWLRNLGKAAPHAEMRNERMKFLESYFFEKLDKAMENINHMAMSSRRQLRS